MRGHHPLTCGIVIRFLSRLSSSSSCRALASGVMPFHDGWTALMIACPRSQH